MHGNGTIVPRDGANEGGTYWRAGENCTVQETLQKTMSASSILEARLG